MVIVTSFSLGMVLVRTDAGQLVMVPQQALAQAQMQAQVQTQGQGPASISPRLSVPTSGPVFRLTTAQVCLAWFHLAFVCFVLLCLVHYQFFDKCASHIFFLIGNRETLTQIQFIISGLNFFFLISEKSTLQVFSSLFRLSSLEVRRLSLRQKLVWNVCHWLSKWLCSLSELLWYSSTVNGCMWSLHFTRN